MACATGGVAPGDCDEGTAGFADSDTTGAFSASAVAPGTITVHGASVSCTASPGACSIVAFVQQGFDGQASASLTFGTPPPPPAAKITTGLGVVREGDWGLRTLSVPVRLSAPSPSTVSVRYFTFGITAKPWRDYLDTAGKVTFAPGETEHWVRIQVIGDHRPEWFELIGVALYAPHGAKIGWPGPVGLGVIADDDQHVAERPGR
jgi:hypothetical protein